MSGPQEDSRAYLYHRLPVAVLVPDAPTAGSRRLAWAGGAPATRFLPPQGHPDRLDISR